MQPSTTPDLGHRMGTQHNNKKHTQESKEASPSQQATTMPQDITKTNMKHKQQKGSAKEAPPWMASQLSRAKGSL